MIGKSVAASLEGTIFRNILPVPRSIPPRTHLPSIRRPRLYFRFPNFASSISTTFPGPPIFSFLLLRYSAQTSLQKLYQSITVFFEMPIHLLTIFIGSSSLQRNVNSKISCKLRWLLKNQEFRRIDLDVLHLEHFHLKNT